MVTPYTLYIFTVLNFTLFSLWINDDQHITVEQNKLRCILLCVIFIFYAWLLQLWWIWSTMQIFLFFFVRFTYCLRTQDVPCKLCPRVIHKYNLLITKIAFCHSNCIDIWFKNFMIRFMIRILRIKGKKTYRCYGISDMNHFKVKHITVYQIPRLQLVCKQDNRSRRQRLINLS